MPFVSDNKGEPCENHGLSRNCNPLRRKVRPLSEKVLSRFEAEIQVRLSLFPFSVHFRFLIFKEKKMNYEEKIQNSVTSVFKVVFPNITNHHNTMFGGTVMEMMDEIAFMTATRFARKSFVTVSCDRIDFKKPIPADCIVQLIGKVKYVGNTSLKVNVEIYVEDMFSESREKAVSGDFTLVSINDEKKPERIFDAVTSYK